MKNRPYVICHMLQSIDGKVTGDFLFKPELEAATNVYYKINRKYRADAFACGRVTMQSSFTGDFYPDLSAFDGVSVPEGDFKYDKEHGFYAVSFDRKGSVGWKTAVIEDEDPGYGNAHIIEVLCEDLVDKRYLAYLRKIGVSYIFGGKTEIDLSLCLEKLRSIFRIETLLLEGGSIINGAFENEGLIDELSLVVAPVCASSNSKPLFMNSKGADFTLVSSEVEECGAIVLKYRKEER